MAYKCRKWDVASTYMTIIFILGLLIFVILMWTMIAQKFVRGGLAISFIGITIAGIGLYWRNRETASVSNCSEYTIIGKSEDSQNAILIEPGEEVSGIDGIWVPWNPDYVLKIPNGVHVCINEYQKRFPTIFSEMVFRNMGGGWYRPEQLGWNLFFSIAQEMFEEM